MVLRSGNFATVAAQPGTKITLPLLLVVVLHS
jgi:hypothetical protein